MAERTRRAYNLHLVDASQCVGDYPYLEAVDMKPARLVGFNEVATSRPDPEAGVHFFLDDYQFERCWSRPDAYTGRLSQYGAVIAPDYSLYTDMPTPMQRWNVYRSRALAAWWQSEGLAVVPVLQWSTPDSYTWALDGLPQGGTVAVSPLGVRSSRAASDLWRQGCAAALAATRPARVLHYGARLDDVDWGGAEVVEYMPASLGRLADWHAAQAAAGAEGE